MIKFISMFRTAMIFSVLTLLPAVAVASLGSECFQIGYQDAMERQAGENRGLDVPDLNIDDIFDSHQNDTARATCMATTEGVREYMRGFKTGMEELRETENVADVREPSVDDRLGLKNTRPRAIGGDQDGHLLIHRSAKPSRAQSAVGDSDGPVGDPAAGGGGGGEIFPVRRK